MAFRFRKSVKLLPGVRLNLSKSGVSVTLGGRGASVNIGSGGTTATVGVPGSGFSYSKRLTGGTSRRSSATKNEQENSTDDALTLNFIQRLALPDHEEAFADGLKAYLSSDEDGALQHWENADGVADAAFLAGCLALNRGDYAAAIADLEQALANAPALGKAVEKYSVELSVSLPITESIDVQLAPDERGARMALAEAYQAAGRSQDAYAQLEALLASSPDDVLLRLSLAELRYEVQPDDTANLQAIVKLAEGVTNESPIHAGLMLYRAVALRKLGLSSAAQESLTDALRKKKDYPNDLLWALRYERILCYEALGQAAKARTETEKLYAEAPDYEDLAQRLNLA